MRRGPDFLGIGAMKAATTWAWHQLKQHPEVKMPFVKEVHYFDRLDISPEEYLAKFKRIPAAYKVGEITPAYLNVPHAPALVRAFCPKAKVFCILRNPVDRAYSHWKVALWAEHKLPPGTTFTEAFTHGHPRNEPHWNTLKEKGNYLKYLRRWYAWLEAENIKVMLYDDLLADSLAFVRNLYSWVGVNPNFVPEKLAKKYNENWSGYSKPMTIQERQLALDYYGPGIDRLEAFLGVDLSAWKS